MKTKTTKIQRYVNITNGDVLYAALPLQETDINGEIYITMSYSMELRRTFLFKKSAVRPEK